MRRQKRIVLSLAAMAVAGGTALAAGEAPAMASTRTSTENIAAAPLGSVSTNLGAVNHRASDYGDDYGDDYGENYANDYGDNSGNGGAPRRHPRHGRHHRRHYRHGGW